MVERHLWTKNPHAFGNVMERHLWTKNPQLILSYNFPIFGKNLIWGRHGASFVDKKSTVIFTRIILFEIVIYWTEVAWNSRSGNEKVLKHKQSDRKKCIFIVLNGEYQSVSLINAEIGETQRICDYTVRGHFSIWPIRLRFECCYTSFNLD